MRRVRSLLNRYEGHFDNRCEAEADHCLCSGEAVAAAARVGERPIAVICCHLEAQERERHYSRCVK